MFLTFKTLSKSSNILQDLIKAISNLPFEFCHMTTGFSGKRMFQTIDPPSIARRSHLSSPPSIIYCLLPNPYIKLFRMKYNQSYSPASPTNVCQIPKIETSHSPFTIPQNPTRISQAYVETMSWALWNDDTSLPGISFSNPPPASEVRVIWSKVSHILMFYFVYGTQI